MQISSLTDRRRAITGRTGFALVARLLAPAVSLILLAGVLLVFVGYFVIYVVYARALLTFPFDYDQGEGF
ncbi:MAG: hypothetical protein RMN25_11920, partial [Anaerolineae bacterium]|nr:hypothetical protein [Thermoflexales bacterium]MDW8408477.1 hypothetical protein [Anaerolineae bacterium]